jgi:tripartite-type tricarboxylate transporter receptor subunit TctC
MQPGIRAVAAAGLLLFGAASAASADESAVARFYKGKQVSVVIGTTPGGGYDLYGRLVARYIGKYIPGNPTVIVNNMPGAASVVALQHVYTVAPKDGTVIGAVYPQAIMEPLLGDRAKARYDLNELSFLGSANSELYVCVVRTDAGVTTLDDFLSKGMILGASAAGGSTRDFPNMLKAVLGAKLTIVSGYAGSNEIMLAIERGEVQGTCGIGWSSVASTRPDWVEGKGGVKVISQEGLTSTPELDRRKVEMTFSRAADDTQRQLMNMFYAPLKFGRPFIMAPGIPPERLAAIRSAFNAALKDPDLLAEAQKLRVDVDGLDAAEMQKLVDGLYRAPPEVVVKAREILGNKM